MGILWSTGGVREGLRFSVAFPSPSSNADKTASEVAVRECLLFVGEETGPLGEGQLISVNKPETRPIAFFFCFFGQL